MDSIPIRRNEIFNILISSLWCRDKARRRVPPLNTQCLQNSAQKEERNVLTVGRIPTVAYHAVRWIKSESKIKTKDYTDIH